MTYLWRCCQLPLCLLPLLLPLIPQRAVESIIENVAERQQADKMAALVNDDEAVHARLADRVEDSVQAIVERACVDAWEVLEKVSAKLD